MRKPDSVRVRRGVAAVTAVVLLLEAATIAFVNWVLGLAVQHQRMSFAGLGTDTMAAGSWAGGGVFALFLAGCATLSARMALRDRQAGRFGRRALVGCAVAHGVVGALVVGLVGWFAFVLVMVILGLLVGTLLLYEPAEPRRRPGPGTRSAAAP